MSDEIRERLKRYLGEYFKKHPVARAIVVVITGLILLVGAVNVASLFLDQNPRSILPLYLVLIALTPIYALFSLALIGSKQDDRELAPIRKEREEIRERIKEKEPDIFDTIQLNLNQLSEYYTINKSQAR